MRRASIALGQVTAPCSSVPFMACVGEVPFLPLVTLFSLSVLPLPLMHLEGTVGDNRVDLSSPCLDSWCLVGSAKKLPSRTWCFALVMV